MENFSSKVDILSGSIHIREEPSEDDVTKGIVGGGDNSSNVERKNGNNIWNIITKQSWVTFNPGFKRFTCRRTRLIQHAS